LGLGHRRRGLHLERRRHLACLRALVHGLQGLPPAAAAGADGGGAPAAVTRSPASPGTQCHERAAGGLRGWDADEPPAIAGGSYLRSPTKLRARDLQRLLHIAALQAGDCCVPVDQVIEEDVDEARALVLIV